jgi:hypothetical protein
VVAVQQGFKLPSEEEIDPCEQDGRHKANLSAAGRVSYPEIPSASKRRLR